MNVWVVERDDHDGGDGYVVNDYDNGGAAVDDGGDYVDHDGDDPDGLMMRGGENLQFSMRVRRRWIYQQGSHCQK